MTTAYARIKVNRAGSSKPSWFWVQNFRWNGDTFTAEIIERNSEVRDPRHIIVGSRNDLLAFMPAHVNLHYAELEITEGVPR